MTLTISPLIRLKTPHGFISHQSSGDEPQNMNLLVSAPPPRLGQPLCHVRGSGVDRLGVPGLQCASRLVR
jgi:hypothetical protein